MRHTRLPSSHHAWARAKPADFGPEIWYGSDMSMKAILVILEDSPVLLDVLETTLLAARRFDAYIEGLRVRAVLTGVIAAGADGGLAVTPDLEESFEREQREATARVRVLFDDFMRDHAVPLVEGDDAAATVSARRVEAEAVGSDLFGSHARVFDLAVAGRPARGAAVPSISTLETLLFESGRPILIAPPEAPTSLGDKIVIAWNGSTETARTVAFAMPFLERAAEVLVLSIINGTAHGPTASAAARHLQRNNVAAVVRDVEAQGRSVGEAILDECGHWGADLLVKGAYTQSRLRQMIFGGATSHILSAAELPIFMAH